MERSREVPTRKRPDCVGKFSKTNWRIINVNHFVSMSSSFLALAEGRVRPLVTLNG